MAIYQRQGSANVSQKEVYQRQGTNNIKIGEEYQRQNTSNILVYQSTNLFIHNCTVEESGGGSYTVKPIDNSKDFYVFFQFGTDSEAGNVSVQQIGETGYFSDTNFYVLNTIPELPQALTEKPHPSTTDLDVVLSFYTSAVSSGENTGQWYKGNTIESDDFVYYYPGSYLNASLSNQTPYEGASWVATVTSQSGDGEISPVTPLPDGSTHVGACLLLYNGVNPSGEVGSVSISLNYSGGILT